MFSPSAVIAAVSTWIAPVQQKSKRNLASGDGMAMAGQCGLTLPLTVSHGCLSAHLAHLLMRFRMIWLGSEDEPERNLAAPAVGSNEPPARSESTPYQQRGEGMVRCRLLANGQTRLIPICNFTARIVRDILWDDELEARREFALEAQVAGQRISLIVPAVEFSRMRWVPHQLGPQAIIYPGQLQHAGAAIQSLSETISSERIFTHLGWRKLGSKWVYLQCGGAIGALGQCLESHVHLPAALRHYETPLPSSSTALR